MKIFKYSLFFLLVLVLVAFPIVQAESFFGIGALIGSAIGAVVGGSTSSTVVGGIIGGLLGSGSGGGSSSPPPPQPQVVDTWYEDNTECGDEYPDITLGWEYEEEQGYEQEEFEISVEDEEGNEYFESHEGSADRFYFDSHFEFGLDHNWEVRVRSGDQWSDWTDGEGFQTPHKFPEADFSYEPEEPKVEELITFTDQSEIYIGSASEIHRKWEFGPGAIPEETIEGYGEEYKQVEIEYEDTDDRDITLEVTDSEGRACSTAKTLDTMEQEIPDWQETGF